MSEKKYVYMARSAGITRCEFVSATDKTITYREDGYRQKRSPTTSDWRAFRFTWKEAHDWLLEKAAERVQDDEERLDYSRKNLAAIEAMQKPEDA